MRKSILLAVLIVAFTAMPAFAAVQSVKVGGDIDSTYLYRTNFNLGVGSGADEYQSLFFTQTRVRIDADLTEKVAATIQLINERVWESSQTATTTDVDLNLAFLVLREMFGSPATVYVGRMGEDWFYGNSFIFNATGSNNSAPGDSGLASVAEDFTKQTALDGVRIVLDYNPLTIDLVFAVIGSGSTTLSRVESDNYLYGTNINYQLNDERNSEIEAYFWKRVDKSTKNAGTGESAFAGRFADTLKIVGARFSTNPIERLNVQGEVAFQGGNDFSVDTATSPDSAINRNRKAWGFQAIVNYQIPILEEYHPMFQYVYTKITGDTDPTGVGETDEDATGWDPFFESQGGGKIYNTLFNLTNAHIHSVALSGSPMEDLMATLSLTGLWLETPLHSTVVGGDLLAGTIEQPDSSGTQAVTFETGSDKTWLGKEFDIDLVYDYTEDVQFGLSYGWFFPGSAFALANSDSAKQFIVNVDVAF